MKRFIFTLLVLLGALAFAVPGFAAEEKSINVYSSQKEYLARPMFEAFTKQTAIKVNLLSGKNDELLARMEQEGEDSPADLLMVADVANLVKADEKDLLQPISSDILNERVPEYLRSEQGTWYGLAMHARAIFYVKGKVDPSHIKTYDDLTKPEWKGRVLARSSLHTYNQSLLGSIIAHKGEEKALAWAKGVAANLARPAQGDDWENLLDAASGAGDVVLSNTYYYGVISNATDDPRKPELAKKLGVIFPNQDSTGAHVNVRGGGVAKYAKHAKEAQQLLEFLASDEGQKLFGQLNYQYPVVPGVKPEEFVATHLGDFKPDTMPLERVGELNAKAAAIFAQTDWK